MTPGWPDDYKPPRGKPWSVPPGTYEPRRVRFVLRDQRVVDGLIHVRDGDNLATFLGSRKGGWLNLTDVCWQTTDHRVGHVVLKLGLVLWAGGIGDDADLLPTAGDVPSRSIELTLENRVTLHAELPGVARRLSDVLSAWGAFVPLRDARLAGGGVGFGEIALNRKAIHVVRELPGEDDDARRRAVEELLADPIGPTPLADLDPADVARRLRARREWFDPESPGWMFGGP